MSKKVNTVFKWDFTAGNYEAVFKKGQPTAFLNVKLQAFHQIRKNLTAM